MSTDGSIRALLRDRRGVAYVEQLWLVCLMLALAAALALAGEWVFGPRFQRGVDTLYSGAP